MNHLLSLRYCNKYICQSLDEGVLSSDPIADSPENLASSLIDFTHQFIFTKVLDVDKWMNAIENDMANDETATKHFQHIKEIVEQVAGDY